MDKETDSGIILKTNDPFSKEALPSNLDLTATLPTQIGLLDSRYEIVYPINSIDNARTFEFSINSHQNELIDPSNIFMYVRYRIANTDGAPLAILDNGQPNADAQVAPADGIVTSLFKNCKVRINDQPVSTGDGLYSYRADLENRLMVSKQVIKSTLNLSGFYNDQVAFQNLPDGKIEWDMRNVKLENIYHNSAYGINRRLWFSAYSKPFSGIARIHSEIFDQPKLLPPTTKLYVAFDRQDSDYFSLLSL